MNREIVLIAILPSLGVVKNLLIQVVGYLSNKIDSICLDVGSLQWRERPEDLVRTTHVSIARPRVFPAGITWGCSEFGP